MTSIWRVKATAWRPWLGLSACLLPVMAAAQVLDGWRMSSADLPALTLPAAVHLSDLDLEYETDAATAPGRETDLNDDGHVDYFVRSAATLCGAGGNCPFAIVDGRTGRRLGTITGSLVVIGRPRVNGFAVLHGWSSTSAEAGDLVGYEFDGHRYRRTVTLSRSGRARDALVNRLRSLPVLPDAR